MGRPKFKPTDEQRRIVETMAGYGIPETGIAAFLSISAKTLRKHFRRELDIGIINANAAVTQCLFKLATSGKCPAATIFWQKSRAGWREVAVLSHVGPTGGAIQLQEVNHGDLDKRITDVLAGIAGTQTVEEVSGPAHAESKAGSRVSVARMESSAEPISSGR
jgi:hypothetical protein